MIISIDTASSPCSRMQARAASRICSRRASRRSSVIRGMRPGYHKEKEGSLLTAKEVLCSPGEHKRTFLLYSGPLLPPAYHGIVRQLITTTPNRSQEEVMPAQETSPAKLSTAAVFPPNSFLENLAVRADGSILVTEILQGRLWYVPPASAAVPAEPVPVHTFDQFTMGIVEAGPDVFYVNTSDPFTAHESYLHRLDLRRWTPGEPARAERVLKFPGQAGGLNGSSLLAPGVIVLADSLA